jgi:hypothetical protein
VAISIATQHLIQANRIWEKDNEDVEDRADKFA